MSKRTSASRPASALTSPTSPSPSSSYTGSIPDRELIFRQALRENNRVAKLDLPVVDASLLGSPASPSFAAGHGSGNGEGAGGTGMGMGMGVSVHQVATAKMLNYCIRMLHADGWHPPTVLRAMALYDYSSDALSPPASASASDSVNGGAPNERHKEPVTRGMKGTMYRAMWERKREGQEGRDRSEGGTQGLGQGQTRRRGRREDGMGHGHANGRGKRNGDRDGGAGLVIVGGEGGVGEGIGVGRGEGVGERNGAGGVHL